MEAVFQELINSFHSTFSRYQCRTIFRNKYIFGSHWAIEINGRFQLQCINCTKCGGYLNSSHRDSLTSNIICNCHNFYDSFDLLDFFYDDYLQQ